MAAARCVKHQSHIADAVTRRHDTIKHICTKQVTELLEFFGPAWSETLYKVTIKRLSLKQNSPQKLKIKRALLEQFKFKKTSKGSHCARFPTF